MKKIVCVSMAAAIIISCTAYLPENFNLSLSSPLKLTASADDEDYDDYDDYDDTDYQYEYTLDTVTGGCTLTDYYSFSETPETEITVPNKVCGYTVTGLSDELFLGSEKLTKIHIPASVVNIGEHSFGYTYNFNDDTFEYDYVKIENFTVCCQKGSAAETYAINNGFNIVYEKNLSDCTITLSSSVFTYNGSAITPTVTVKDGEKLLTMGTDYTLSYTNNINAGNGVITLQGIGSYLGTAEKIFTIAPASAAYATVSSIGTMYYTGSQIKPALSVSLAGKAMINGTDYTVTYISNKEIGTAYAIITFKGNYVGSKTVSFSIKLNKLSGSKYSSSDSTITLSWSKVAGATGYYVYKYNSSSKKYSLIKTVTANSYKLSKLTSAAKYKYMVTPFRTVNGTKYYGDSAIINAVTKPKSTKAKVCAYDKKAKISWSKVSRCSGYEIQYCKNPYVYIDWYTGQTISEGTFVHYKYITSKSKLSYTATKLDNNKHYLFRVRSYYICDGKKIYSKASSSTDTYSAKARLQSCTKLKQSRYYKTYNVTKSKTTSSSNYISNSEWAYVKKFAKKHFKKGMTSYEKALTAFNYIVKNTNYQYNYSKINGARPVYQVLAKHEAQCDGYNGAMVAIMRYLGYNVNLVQGTVHLGNGTIGSHFWCEMKLNNQTFVIDTNMEYYFDRTSPSHFFFVTKYRDENSSGRYIKNKKTIYK